MFYDWLKIYQDFEHEIPLIGDTALHCVDAITGNINKVLQPRYQHEGSFSTSISISISGNRITVDGNPSRMNRIDNLFGLTSIDSCVNVYNRILKNLGLPQFTKCSKVSYLQGEDGTKVKKTSDGAIITRLDITSNRATGNNCSLPYIKAVSTQPFRHMKPHLYPNGRTAAWFSDVNSLKASRMMFPSVYEKAFEIRKNHAKKIEKQFGLDSHEYKYIKDIIKYCDDNGVVRFEQKLKPDFLTRHGFNYWGLFKDESLKPYHDEFINIDKNLQVTAMTIENISDRLIRESIVENTKAANTTAMYAIQWSTGQTFDLSKSAVKTHRARLRKIGIDIAIPCDLSKFSLINIVRTQEIEVSYLSIPHWYKQAA